MTYKAQLAYYLRGFASFTFRDGQIPFCRQGLKFALVFPTSASAAGIIGLTQYPPSAGSASGRWYPRPDLSAHQTEADIDLRSKDNEQQVCIGAVDANGARPRGADDCFGSIAATRLRQVSALHKAAPSHKRHLRAAHSESPTSPPTASGFRGYLSRAYCFFVIRLCRIKGTSIVYAVLM